MPPAGFMPDAAAGLEVVVADGLEHHEDDGRRRRGLDLAGRGLDEVRAGGHGEVRGASDVVVGLELSGLEDDLQVRGPAGLLDGDDLLEDPSYSPERNAPRSMTMSISSAPIATARRVSSILTGSGTWPAGKPVATEATLTPLPASASLATGTRFG